MSLQTTLTTNKDTHADKNYPSVAQGNMGYVQVVAEGGEITCIGYLGFSLLTIPSNAIITQCKLVIQVYLPNVSPKDCYIGYTMEPWGEGTLTWNNRPSYTYISQYGYYIDEGTLNLAVPLPEAAITNGDITYVFEPYFWGDGYGDQVLITSKETSALLSAKLVIDYEIPYTINAKIAAVEGTINKQVVDMKVASVQGAIDKKLVASKIAPTEGSVNKIIL